MTAREDAVKALRQALLDEGIEPGTVEGMLHMVKPTETNIVGNYADLQRMGAIAQTGTLPTPPGEEDIDTDDITEAFVPIETAGDGNGAAVDTDAMTKADLQAELDSRGVTYSSSATKAELQELLG